MSLISLLFRYFLRFDCLDRFSSEASFSRQPIPQTIPVARIAADDERAQRRQRQHREAESSN